MRTTKQETRGNKTTNRTLDSNELLALITGEKTKEQCETFRKRLQAAVAGKCYNFTRKLPRLLFAGAFKTEGNQTVRKEYNGRILLEINHLGSQEEAQKLRDKVAAYPQTQWAFVGSSGKSVKFVIPYTRPDGTLPQTDREIEMFHAHAFRHAIKTYEPRISYPIELKQPSPAQSCRLSYDPQAYYNPEAFAIQLQQPTEMPTKSHFQEQFTKMEAPETSGKTWYENQRYISIQFELALGRALKSSGNLDSKLDFKPLLHQLAEDCFGAGIPEEDTVKWTMLYWGGLINEVEIRETVNNTYLMKNGFGERKVYKPEQLQALQVNEFMMRRYDFRRNVMTGMAEYREKGTFCFDFRPVTEQVFNSITLNAQLEGLQLWDRDVRRYINSDRVQDFSPVDDYLHNLPRWDGNDHIRQLAERVKCDNPQWTDLFHRWFLGMVAYWQERDTKHANSTSPLLVGPQGIDKSTFCINILPPELNIYYTDDLDFSEKRNAMLYLNRFLLINLDEFDQTSANHQGFLKHLLQKPSVNVRKPHSAYIEKVRRYASFIATSNHDDLLNDPSGSRRFICVHVSTIDNSQPVDYQQLYAQAIAELDRGERYWFTREEGIRQTESNSAFRQQPAYEQLFHEFFRSAENDTEGRWMQTIEIFQYLQKKGHIKLGTSMLSVFGRFLSKLGLEVQHTRTGTFYKVVERKRIAL
ncbi:BT4734/BF3469 family protein [Phocaeicola sp.]